MTGPWYNSLRVQIVLLLTVALFPLGTIAIYQTNQVASEAEQNAELALLAWTGRAAKAEELVVERAFGAAQFFAEVAPDFIADPGRCNAELAPFVADNDIFSFVGILPISGVVTCSSAGRTFDFSDYPNFAEDIAAQKATIVVDNDAPLSGKSVFIISEPFDIDGRFAGFISISVPHETLPGISEEYTQLGLEELITFNTDGDILTAQSDLDTASGEIPVGILLADLRSAEGEAFQGTNARGQRRTYTVVPIDGSPATVMGVWRVDEGVVSSVAAVLRPAVFPVLMWLASMTVAMLSIYTLVLRHIGKLRQNMDAFAKDRHTDDFQDTGAMPNELQALQDNFTHMTHNLLQDEARLEDTVREKNVLIKEVHHRVKNNLQLISSIMNMQIRNAQQEETKSVLSRLQDRVLSLATIHRDLYQSQHGGRVNVGDLMTEVLQSSLEVALSNPDTVDVQTDIDPVLLYPDQAVPLSLMMAEATTNAMKYFGAQHSNKPWIKVSLKHKGNDCVLTIANSVGEARVSESTGLGSQLINAFTIQLGGKIDTKEEPDSYTMVVRFKVEEFEPEVRDF